MQREQSCRMWWTVSLSLPSQSAEPVMPVHFRCRGNSPAGCGGPSLLLCDQSAECMMPVHFRCRGNSPAGCGGPSLLLCDQSAEPMMPFISGAEGTVLQDVVDHLFFFAITDCRAYDAIRFRCRGNSPAGCGGPSLLLCNHRL